MATVNKFDLHLRNYGVSVRVDCSQIPEVSDEVQALFARIHHAPPPNINNADSAAKKDIRNLTQQIASHQTSFCKMIPPTMHLIVTIMCTAVCVFLLCTPLTLGFPIWLGILLALCIYSSQIELNILLLIPNFDPTFIGGISQQCTIDQIRELQKGLKAFQPNVPHFRPTCCYWLNLLLNPFFFFLEYARISCCGWNRILRHQDKVIKEEMEAILLESIRYYTSYSDELRDRLSPLEDEQALEQLEKVSRYYTDLSKQLRNKVLPLVVDKSRVPRFHPGIDGLILEYALF